MQHPDCSVMQTEPIQNLQAIMNWKKWYWKLLWWFLHVGYFTGAAASAWNTATAKKMHLFNRWFWREAGGWLPVFPCWNNYTAAMIGDIPPLLLHLLKQGNTRDNINEPTGWCGKMRLKQPAKDYTKMNAQAGHWLLTCNTGIYPWKTVFAAGFFIKKSR